MRYEIIVVGTSWGGLAALKHVVSSLPPDFGLPVVVVQHRHPDSDQLLAAVLQERTSLPVCEVEDKAPIVGGHVNLAPPNYHLLVDRGHFSLSTDAPVRFSRPSIDVTFMSAADSYGGRVVGIVLTGANADGARGLRRIVDRGGLAVVQRPETAESPIMPSKALHVVPEARALTLAEIGELLGSFADGASGKRARDVRSEGGKRKVGMREADFGGGAP